MGKQQEQAQKCIDGQSFWVCSKCADKYSKKPPYKYPLTMHLANCDICGCYKPVGPSRKLFGHYKSDIHKD